MFEIEKIDTYSVFDIYDDETKLEATLYVEGDKNELLVSETEIKTLNTKVVYERDSLFIDLVKPHKKNYRHEADALSTKLYSLLASLKDLSHSINVFENDENVHIRRFMKGSGRPVQEIAFHPNDLMEISYSNLSHGKVFFIFKFTENRALFLNRERIEFIKGNQRLQKFGDFRFLDNPLRKIV